MKTDSSRYSVPRKGQDSWIPLILFLRLAFLGILEIYIFFLDHKAVKGSSQTLVTGLQIPADLCVRHSAQNSPCRHRPLQWRAYPRNWSSPFLSWRWDLTISPPLPPLLWQAYKFKTRHIKGKASSGPSGFNPLLSGLSELGHVTDVGRMKHEERKGSLTQAEETDLWNKRCWGETLRQDASYKLTRLINLTE